MQPVNHIVVSSGDIVLRPGINPQVKKLPLPFRSDGHIGPVDLTPTAL